MLFVGNGESTRGKHRRAPKCNKKPKIKIIRDQDSINVCNLARGTALQAFKEKKCEKVKNGVIDTTEESATRKISIWRTAFERAYDKVNNKINELFEQIKKSDKRAQILNKGFYNNVSSLNRSFYSDLAAMNRESEKRSFGFASKHNTKKFINDLNTLHTENEKRNVGFHCKKNKTNHDSKFKQLCEESYKRNDIYKNRRETTGMDKMKMLNESRTASFMAKRPDSKFATALSLNDDRSALFRNKKPMTKLEEITKWNAQRNAMFHLRSDYV